MGVSTNVGHGIKRGGTIGHEQVGDPWKNFDEIAVLAQHFTVILVVWIKWKSMVFLRKT